MKRDNKALYESIMRNVSKQVKRALNENEMDRYDECRHNWKFFNFLITDVQLSEDQYIAMFDNLSDQQFYIWVECLKECYVGAPEEDETNRIKSREDLARFYANHPITY